MLTWDEGNALAMPFVQVVDGGVHFEAFNQEGLTLAQVAQDYGASSENQTPRAVQVRAVSDGAGVGAWEQFVIPVAVEPLTALSWNQGGWPGWNGVDSVVVLDGDTFFNALDPESWTLERAVMDYYNSYACENKEPHDVQIRRCTASGNTALEPFSIPLSEEEPEE